MANEKLNINAFLTLIAQGEELPQFVAFVDGDQVEQGDNFQIVAINASELRYLRGPKAQLEIFDTKSKIPL